MRVDADPSPATDWPWLLQRWRLRQALAAGTPASRSSAVEIFVESSRASSRVWRGHAVLCALKLPGKLASFLELHLDFCRRAVARVAPGRFRVPQRPRRSAAQLLDIGSRPLGRPQLLVSLLAAAADVVDQVVGLLVAGVEDARAPRRSPPPARRAACDGERRSTSRDADGEPIGRE